MDFFMAGQAGLKQLNLETKMQGMQNSNSMNSNTASLTND